ncbi:hypothetical protein H5T54_00315 [Candidatus Bipolaricaulota bacterium]|nr:hypothetical protein [Candidatus Bipolaricaulota bacterium]
MPEELTKEEWQLCWLAAFPAGILSSSSFFERMKGPWFVALGWAALGFLIFVVTVLFWAAVLSILYERVRLSVKRKQLLVFFVGSAIPFISFIVAMFPLHGIREPFAIRLLSALGFAIGGSLAWAFISWGLWRFLCWVERRQKKTQD